MFGLASADVIRYHVIRHVQRQTVPSRDAMSGGRLACAAPATDPVDVAQPCPQRCCVISLHVLFNRHSVEPVRRTYDGRRGVVDAAVVVKCLVHIGL